MNILFIYSQYDIASLRKPLESPELMQFGISYISSFLKNRGHNTKLMVLSRISGKENETIINKYISNFKPHVIAFTSVSTEFGFINDIARYVRKEFPEIYLLIGGPHVSLNPDGVLHYFDALCIGEGEISTLELVSQLEKNRFPSGIKNLWIRHGQEVERNSPRPFLEDLDSLPFPDRHMWDEWIQERPSARPAILLGRGCQFECSYCCNHALKKLASGPYIRYRSPDNIVKEIRELLDNYPDRHEIYLEVESIGIDKEWVALLCDKLASFNETLTMPLTFGANMRIMPNLDLENIFRAFKKANFRFVNVGLESGSERLRKEVLNRHYSNKDVINTVRLGKEYGLRISLLNMIGLPTETLTDFKKTVELNRICNPDWIGYSIFFPYPGTKIYTYCENAGLLRSASEMDIERSRAVFDLPGFSRRRIQGAYTWFEYDVYKGQRPAFRLLANVVRLKIQANPFLFLFYKRLRKIFSIQSGDTE